ncbi:7-carboxy-7-deazaguanine synthase [mine drainage metagenome]|uniref:7-carboxy-7-deazaguanine synthase n=1 Tax=mine drainage metagenome TaxID=410659 RepID=A0A1J5S4G3_9ZZZZ
MAVAAGATLKISEIFHSLQGESSRVGLPTVFVRLTGCPLRCTWCDTDYAFTGGSSMSVAGVLAEVGRYGCGTVCVTGGEPLAQRSCPDLLKALCDAGYSVSLETSGALDLAGVDPRVAKIMDLKAPGSGESEKNRWQNLAQLTASDEIKFVLASEADYQWAKTAVGERKLDALCPVLFSPVAGQLDSTQLAGWILRDRLPVRFQLQLHKLLWGAERGR